MAFALDGLHSNPWKHTGKLIFNPPVKDLWHQVRLIQIQLWWERKICLDPLGPFEAHPLTGACKAVVEADVLFVGAHCTVFPCGKRVYAGIHAYTMKEFCTIWEMSSHKIKTKYSKEREKNNKHFISLSEQTMEHVFLRLQRVRLLCTEFKQIYLAEMPTKQNCPPKSNLFAVDYWM